MKKVVLLVLCFMSAGASFAASNAGVFKLSLWNNLAIAAPANTQTIHGIDFGIGSHTNEVYGVQLDLVMAQTRYDLRGVSAAWLISLAEDVTGAQWAAFTKNAHLTGAQLGLVNLSGRQVTGAQLGFFNQAEAMNGLQFGFVNYAKQIYGLQMGILNIAENGWFPAMVLVNGRF